MAPIFKKVVFWHVLLLTGVVFAQRDTTKTDQDSTKATDIDTERLIITKSYSPTVNDAFKLKQTPQHNKPENREKKTVDYDIITVPVASTFKPEKGSASGLEQEKQPETYDTYIALGIGNYTNILAELYSNIDFSDTQNLTIGLNHHSSQGDINGVELDDNYYDTDLDLDYMQEENKLWWDIRGGFRHQLYNWYGVPKGSLSSDELTSIHPKHNYYDFNLGGDIRMKEGAFDKISLDYRHFEDDFDSHEDYIQLKPDFQFPVGENSIHAKIMTEYLDGKSGRAGSNKKYGYFNFGFHPSYKYSSEKFAMDLGLQVLFNDDRERNENHVYVYPKVKASYRIAGDYFSIYAGAKGGLEQNTYRKMTEENPFVAPLLFIQPTNKQVDAFVGTNGKFTDHLHYDLRFDYTNEEDKPLFIHSPTSGFDSQGPFGYNNSFGLVYDDIDTYSLYGKLSYDLRDDFEIGLDATYYHYSTDEEAKAWNLPEWEANFNLDYQISKRWFVGADLFMVGEREDRFGMENSFNPERVKLDRYFDANLRVDFQITDQVGIFARGNNLFNDNYKRWYAYKVQGIQGMLGLSFQF